MKAFVHRNATTIAEASSLLASYQGQAAVLAGGTDILGVIKDDILEGYPQALVNIKTIPGLDTISADAGGLKLGPLCKIADIALNATVKGSWPALSTAAGRVSSAILREMGTLGGNLCQSVRCWYYRFPQHIGGRFECFRKGGALCYAVPGENQYYHSIVGGEVCFAGFPSDTAIALSALNATIVTNKRSIPIDDFYVVLGNVLGVDEFITEVQVPAPAAGTTQSFTKNTIRKAIDWALVSVGSAITVSGGTVASARIYLGGVSPVPYRATAAESAITGQAITDALATTAGAAAVANAEPLSGNAYKIQIAKTLVKRAILA